MANLDGTANGERIDGTPTNDRIDGLAGDDKLLGFGGSDILIGGPGSDILNGGEGTDTAQYLENLNEFVIQQRSSGNYVVYQRNGDVDLLIDIERARFGNLTQSIENFVRLRSDFNPDTVVGGDFTVNNLSGTSGNDLMFTVGGPNRNVVQTMFGAAGDDVMLGSVTVDRFIGGAGDDTFIGFTNDRAVYSGNSTAYEVITNTAGDFYVVGAATDIDTIIGLRRIDFDDRTLTTINLPSDVRVDFEKDQIEYDTNASQSLTGNRDDNVLAGLSGNDILDGERGNDFLLGGSGDDRLIGGQGDDTLIGGIGTDTAAYEGPLARYAVIRSTTGDFVVFGGVDGTDILDQIERIDFGGEERTAGLFLDVATRFDADTAIVGMGSADLLVGGVDDDLIIGLNGDDRLFGRAGIDTLLGGAADDFLDGGTGDDALAGGSGNDQLFGQAGADRLIGGDGRDRIFGGADDDAISGDDGNDTLNGGTGNDLILGNTGNDTLAGEAGDDTLKGNAGRDRLLGGGGDDTLDGGQDNDRLFGGTGADELIGSGGDDILSGGTGDDTLSGGAGADLLFGNFGDDFLNGGDGDDVLMGDFGTDDLRGGAGNDRLDGGLGIESEALYGGSGADIFVFNGGSVFIGDFEGGMAGEVIEMSTRRAADFTELSDLIDQSRYANTIEFDNGALLTFGSGVTIDSLVADDFVFV